MTHWDEYPLGPDRDQPPSKPRGWNADSQGGGRHSARDDRDEEPFNGFQLRHTDPRGIRPTSPVPPQSPARPFQAGRPVSPAGPTQPRSGPPVQPRSGPPVQPRSGPPMQPRSGPPGAPRSGPPGSPRSGPPGPGDPGGRRSHWVDEWGVDNRGRLIIDADEVSPAERRDPSTVNRRLALLAFAGVAGGAAIALAPQGLDLGGQLFGGPAELPDALSHDTLPGDGSTRPAGQQASKARTYTEQNDSYMGSDAGKQVRQNTPQKGTTKKTPQTAANTPKPVAVSALGTDPIRHLASRVTFGATPKLLADIKKMGIDAWLGWQLEPDKIPLTRAEVKLGELTTLTKSIDQLRADREANDKAGIRPEQETIEATIARQIWSDRQLFEVMVDFWNDFLHVAAFFDGAEIQRASFDRDVIRKHALGSYPEMFVAANRHPALINYLDQNQSGKNNVNENLARENLELFTVGVDGGYTEKDVRQAALLQTGRSIRDDKYVYRADQHYVGPVEIMGFTHANADAAGGEAAAEEYFRYIALHPSTANYIATNLAARLVSDTPPKSLVDRVAAAYLKAKGQIKPTLVTLLSSTEFWGSVGQKVRRPMEYLVATYRTLGVQADTPATFKNDNPNASPFLRGLREIRNKLEQLGQFPTGMATPNGYPDVFVAWTSAGTMVDLWNEALGIIEGRRGMFTYVTPDKLLGTAPPATAGAYVDALAKRLVHQTFTARERALILDVAGVAANTPVDASFNGAIRAVARAILASPHHHLR